jgi:hypothetical protein
MKRRELTYNEQQERIWRIESRRGVRNTKAWLRRQIAALRQKLKALK